MPLSVTPGYTIKLVRMTDVIDMRMELIGFRIGFNEYSG
jgi:hypothetical protein